MSFPPKIKEDALIASGRCCCLCHKFCGIKMDVHHIKQAADGGDNSFENAIPLCFDCHADMTSYDPRHPKGNKYTESELRGHRDNWYKKVKGNIGIADHLAIVETDKKIYQNLIEILPWNGGINYLKHCAFQGSINLDRIDDLQEFIYKSENPAFEFVDPDLESLRAALQKEIDWLIVAIQTKTFPTNSPKIVKIPIDMQTEQPDKYDCTLKVLESMADNIHGIYSTLIRTAVRKLGILPPDM